MSGAACEPRGLPGYHVVRPIASGGMGRVFEVIHRELGRVCALKVLHERHRDRADHAARMRFEARVMAGLNNPHVPRVYDCGTLDDGRPYFVMDRLVGADLRALVDHYGPLAPGLAVRLAIELLEVLDELHDQGFLHRDIKLDNLFLSQSGSLSLIDFGLVRRLDDPLRLTRRGFAIGTPRTMAPEQHEGEELDRRCDVYGAGVALFELLTGLGPFDAWGPTAAALREAHCDREPPSLALLAPFSIPFDLERIVLRALAKRPGDRFTTAAAMARALAGCALAGEPDDAPTVVDPWAEIRADSTWI